MCLSVPAQILSIEGDFAKVSVGGSIFSAGIQMIDKPQVGEFVLLHAGFAIQRISDEEARETLKLLDDMHKTLSNE